MSLTYIDGLVVDDDTGEVVDWPEGAPGGGPERIAFLTNAALGAQAAERDSKLAYDTYRRVIGGLLAEAGEAALSTEYGRPVRIADGTQKKAPATQVAAAVGAELLAHSEAMELLIAAAKELDVEVVERFIGGMDEERRATLRAVLLMQTPRSGYVRIYPPKARPPRVEKVTANV